MDHACRILLPVQLDSAQFIYHTNVEMVCVLRMLVTVTRITVVHLTDLKNVLMELVLVKMKNVQIRTSPSFVLDRSFVQMVLVLTIKASV